MLNLTWTDYPEPADSQDFLANSILSPRLSENFEHVLIKGDNYPVLKKLGSGADDSPNLTASVDLIYIDPPYNTGSDGFTYKDKRFLSQFPDGTTIPKEHPLRHSTWLSFMSKRLELAKNLLSEKGVIFISIDDNEQANLKLLCDQIFGEENFIAYFNWRKKTGANDAKDIAIITESIIAYAKSKSFSIKNNIWANDKDSVNSDRYKYKDKYFGVRGKFYYDTLDRGGLQYSDSMNFGIKMPDGKVLYPNGRDHFENDGWIWKWSKEKVEWGIENNFLEFTKTNKNLHTDYTIKYKVYENVDNEGKIRTKKGRAFTNLITEPINQQGNSEIKDLFNEIIPFSNPKPIGLIQYLVKTLKSKSSTILDFFAGSGTTLHATMKLNAEDGGNRQCILVQQKERDNNICQNITYERNRRVMQGYTNPKGDKIEGLGNSLKYYRTAFVGENEAEYATDKDKILLSKKAGCLLSMAENTLEEYISTDRYQIFGDDKNSFTGIYFSANADKISEFTAKLEQLRNLSSLNEINAYFFSSGDGTEFSDEFESRKNIKIKSIPEPILEVYRRLN